MENHETETVLNDLNRLAAALRGINKAKATLRKWRKAAKAGRVTSDQVANAEAVLRESLAADLALAMEAGFGLGQGDEMEWESRAAKVAAHIVR